MGFKGAAVLAVTIAACLLIAAPAGAAPVPPGAKWSQATIDSTDGVKLHADILRPANVPANKKVPVILSIGPTSTTRARSAPPHRRRASATTRSVPSPVPSDRFFDFVNGAKLMKRGYAYVMVDLRGFGSSTGCLDWGGPGEQSDVVSGDPLGGHAVVVDRQGRHVRQVL